MHAKLESQTEWTDEESPSRYIVGVDLGTTNSALCYVDTSQEPRDRAPRAIETFAIPQLAAPGQVEDRDTLPSFHFQPPQGSDAALFRCPWDAPSHTADYAVGVLAREQAALTPGRVIASAKSWLCHTGVDRTAALLPWQGAADAQRLSPVEASSRYLEHLRRAWDAKFPREPLAEQDIVLTLPASFDEVARELTVEAARKAGLPRVVLIEEPQAAFYGWLHRHADSWTETIQPGHRILICDVGGGTSDFTLIHVEPGDSSQAPVRLHRAAVGDHLILGGDNLDLALAQMLEREAMGDQRLPPRQWESLWKQCRGAKEQLFSTNAPERWSLHLAAEGSKLIGGGRQMEIRRDEMREQLLEGFFPRSELGDSPQRQTAGFQEFGLPYATDPSVTKYLAEFLRNHPRAGASSDDPLAIRPDAVLFNGGVFLAEVIRDRVIAALEHWFNDATRSWSPIVLDFGRLDLAVAQGAAYYGLVRRGEGVKINAGLARSYYVGVAAEEPVAVCLAPAGVESGEHIELPERRFRLLANRPVVFPLYASSVRLNDAPGDVTPVNQEELRALAPITTVVQGATARSAEQLEVELVAKTTEIGALELWCREVETERSWRLQFDVRAAVETDRDTQATSREQFGVVDESTWMEVDRLLTATFEDPFDSPSGLANRLSEQLQQPRGDWPPTLLRRIWERLRDLSDGRRKSPNHEARWLNLTGFALRPGFGVALDDWRVDETWKLLQGKLHHAAAECRSESWILWRRIAGGLASGQQNALADPLLKSVRQMHRKLNRGGKSGGRGLDFSPHEAAEMWRLLGALERLPLRVKVELGDMLAVLADKPKAKPMRDGLLWALARTGARQPAYGLLNDVAPREAAARWLAKLLATQSPNEMVVFAVAQLARKTDDRYRDIDGELRDRVRAWMDQHAAESAWRTMVDQAGVLDRDQQKQVLGDTLPLGLSM